jgi:hypothetical protein
MMIVGLKEMLSKPLVLMHAKTKGFCGCETKLHKHRNHRFRADKDELKKIVDNFNNARNLKESLKVMLNQINEFDNFK